MPRRARRTALLAALAVAVPILVGVTAAPAAATAATIDSVRLNGHEAAMVRRINEARVARGLPKVRVAAGATDVARRWSWTIARTGVLAHNPAFPQQLGAAGSASWTWVTENVAYGPANDPGRMFEGYMNSAGHRANILDPKVRWVGIGSVDRTMPEGWLLTWNTMNFVDSYSTTYGRTRKPADGLRLDARQLAPGTVLAGFESGYDARAETARTGAGVTTSRVRFGRPTSGDDGASFTVKRATNLVSGYADLLLRDAVDLAATPALVLRLGQTNPNRRALTVQVLATNSWGSPVLLGTVSVPHGRTTVRLPVPDSGRGFRDALRVRVTKRALGQLSPVAAERVATVSVYSVATA